MAPDPMNDQQMLEQLLLSKTIQPRGWFRWLHNHFMGRYGVSYPHLIAGDSFCNAWGKISDKPEPLCKRVGTTEQWVTILNRNAWAAGMRKMIATVGQHWQMLDREARGAFFAGLSEQATDKKAMTMALEKLPEMDFSPETLCQLACNAAKYRYLKLLNALLVANKELLGATVNRSDCTPSSGLMDDRETLDSLSNRVIDMILEAAIQFDRTDAMRIALHHGADPNIPIWQLERSYNRRYSILGYAIDTDQMAAVDLLLEYGADPSGGTFAGYGAELHDCLKRNDNYTLADRLIKLGAKFPQPSTSPGSKNTVQTGGSEHLVLAPRGSFWGFFPVWVQKLAMEAASIIPFVPVAEKGAYFKSHGQGGDFSTFLTAVMHNLERLKHYEQAGMDTRLSIEEFCVALKYKSMWPSLYYLLEQYGESTRTQVIALIEEHIQTDHV